MATVKEIAADTEVLMGDIRELEKKLGESRTQLNKMVSSVNDLSAMWQGTAHTAFVSQFENDRQMTEELFETVNSIIESMTFAKKEYDICEVEIEEIVASIGI